VKLTDVQAAMLEALPIEGQQQGRTARQVAHDVWPDDPAWRKRTHGRGASRHNGALGATMPLRAGRVLAALERRGLAQRGDRGDGLDDRRWWRTWAGHQALTDSKPSARPS
jgi:hypothetical protein